MHEYAGQMADTLNNTYWVFDHFEKIQGNLRACSSIEIRRLLLQQLYLAKNLSWCLLNDGRELQSKVKEAQTTPLRWRRIHGVAGNGEREQSLLKSTPRQASNYRAYASTAKDLCEQALIYGSGLCVTLKAIVNQLWFAVQA